MRRLRLRVVLVVSVLVATSCQSAPSDTTSVATSTTAQGGVESTSPAAGQADTLTIAVSQPIDTLDPAAQNSWDVMQRLMLMVECLTWIDEEGTLQPWLATSWEASSDGLSYTLSLREGVQFSDGEPFDAAAVKFSLERVNDPNTFQSQPSELSKIAEVVVLDDSHVQIVLESPYAALPRLLALTNACIISPKSVDVAPNTPERIVEPVGTGPYVFEEYGEDHLTVTVNPNYWGETPTFQTQIWRVVPDASTRLAMFQSGEADVIMDPPAPSLPDLVSDPSVQLQHLRFPGYLVVDLNTQSETSPLLQQREVRQALNYAIDRDLLVERLLSGSGIVADGPIPSTMFGDCDAGDYKYDPERARQMLADAGASDLSVTMYGSNGGYLNDYEVAQAIAGQLREVGVEVNLQPPTDFASFISFIWLPLDARATDMDLLMIGSGSVFLDGGNALLNYDSMSLPPNGYNGALYENPEFDELRLMADQEPDEARRAELLCDAQKILVEDAPAIWLYTPLSPIVTSPSLTGLIPAPHGLLLTAWAKPAE